MVIASACGQPTSDSYLMLSHDMKVKYHAILGTSKWPCVKEKIIRNPIHMSLVILVLGRCGDELDGV